MKRQFAAAQRLAVLTGIHPHAFPNIGDPDPAWQWYAENNPYVTGRAPGDPLAPAGLLGAQPFAGVSPARIRSVTGFAPVGSRA